MKRKGLSNYNTSKFYFDPKKEGEFKRLRSEGLFDFDPATWSHEGLSTWIALMYDPESELRKEIKNYPERKAVAADLCDFNRNEDGRFAPRLEHYLVGGNVKFNRACVEYMSKSNSRLHMTQCVKEFVYTVKLADSLTNYDKETHDLTTKLFAELQDLDNSLFGGEEVKKMKEALYASGEAVRLRLRREDIVKMSEEELKKLTAQYGEEYKEGKLKYAGDSL